MNEDWIGRTLERESLNDLIALSLRYRFNLDGEGGEFETIVVSAPHMKRDVVVEGDVVWSGSRGSLELHSCKLS